MDVIINSFSLFLVCTELVLSAITLLMFMIQARQF